MSTPSKINELATELTTTFGQAIEATREGDRMTVLAMPARVHRDKDTDVILLFPNPDKNFFIQVIGIGRESDQWTVHTPDGDWVFRRPTDERNAAQFIREMNDAGIHTMETNTYLVHSVGPEPRTPIGIHYDGAEHYVEGEANNWSSVAAGILAQRQPGERWDDFVIRVDGYSSPLGSYTAYNHRNWPLGYILGNLRYGEPPII